MGTLIQILNRTENMKRKWDTYNLEQKIMATRYAELAQRELLKYFGTDHEGYPRRREADCWSQVCWFRWHLKMEREMLRL